MSATPSQPQGWSIRYLWALRVPLIAAAVVLALPCVAFSEAMHPYFSGLFDPLTPRALILVTALALFNVWTCLLMGALILTYGTDRLGLPELTRKFLPIKWRYWPITALLIGPVLWRTIWYMATASGHAVGETALYAGAGVVIAVLLLVLSWRIGELFDRKGGSARERVKATWPGRRYQAVLNFLEKHRALGAGFVGKDSRNKLVLLEGHGLAFGLACSSVLLYVATGYFTSDVHRPELASTLAYVLLILLVLTWLIGFLAFLFDRGRVPLIVIGGLWILFVNLVLHHAFSTDHIYRTVEPREATDLIQPTELLVAGQPTIVVAASGGGIQAAAWTAQTLNAMRAEPGFAEHLRLVSAVSGGSVGTMYALAAIPGCGPQAEDTGALAAFDPNKAAQESSLHAVGWGLVFKDLPRAIAPFFSNPYVDRGSVLEDAWKREPRLRRMFPDRAPYLASWRPTRDGRECPGVIFNAMTASSGEPMLFSTVGLPDALKNFDFYHRYPGRDIPMTTAVRLSATFPYVSPAARADVDDEKRGYTHVVDGGYFDNYGVSSLAAVMHTALEALPSSTTKRRVLVVEICDSATCSGDPAPEGPSMGGKDRGWPYQIFAPLSAFMAMRSSAQRVTNRTTLRLLKDYWRLKGTCIESVVVPFNNGKAPMSWHLTGREKQQITDGWNRIAAEKLGAVRRFLAGQAATKEGAGCLAAK